MNLTARLLQRTASIEEQLQDLMERRSFTQEERGPNWFVFARETSHGKVWLKIFTDGGQVTKTDMFDEVPEQVINTRLGWDGLKSFTNTFGD